MAADLGDKIAPRSRIHADASVALGVLSRLGVGKVRHLDTRLLWVQQSKHKRHLDYEKVWGSKNPSDALTKYVNREGLDQLLISTGCETREGRAGGAPLSS